MKDDGSDTDALDADKALWMTSAIPNTGGDW